MSKTIRRKTCSTSPFELEWRHFNSYSRNWFQTRFPHLSVEEILVHKNKRFHTDNFSNLWSLASFFKHFKIRSIKAKNRNLFKKAWKNEEEFVEIPFKQTFRKRN